MAYIEKTAFEVRVSNNKNNDLCNVTGKYFVSDVGEADICSAGILCEVFQELDCEGFTGISNENAWKMLATTVDGTNTSAFYAPIYAANTYDWPTIQDSRTGNVYAIGSATLGLPIPKDKYGTFTKIEFDGQSRYRFGVGNISGNYSAASAFTIENGLLKPVTDVPTVS